MLYPIYSSHVSQPINDRGRINGGQQDMARQRPKNAPRGRWTRRRRGAPSSGAPQCCSPAMFIYICVCVDSRMTGRAYACGWMGLYLSIRMYICHSFEHNKRSTLYLLGVRAGVDPGELPGAEVEHPRGGLVARQVQAARFCGRRVGCVCLIYCFFLHGTIYI